jgi:hypothetical protein
MMVVGGKETRGAICFRISINQNKNKNKNKINPPFRPCYPNMDIEKFL